MCFLWEEELEESFEKFLESGEDVRAQFEKELESKSGDMEEEQLTIERENFEEMMKKIYDGVATKQPSLEKFDEQILHLSEVNHIIQNMQESSNIGWLKVNSSPLIEELKSTCKMWIDKFTTFLLDNTTRKLHNIEKWTSEVNDGINTLPNKDMEKFKKSQKDKALLQTVMTHLRDVKQIREKTLDQIGPMRETIQLLKKHQEHINLGEEDYIVRCENTKSQLTEVSERALGPVKESILPLQKSEAENVKERRERFMLKVKEYRLEFKDNLPYSTRNSNADIINGAYDKVSEFYGRTLEMEEERDALTN